MRLLKTLPGLRVCLAGLVLGALAMLAPIVVHLVLADLFLVAP